MPLAKNPKYDLRRKYNRFVETSLIISLVALIAAFMYIPAPEDKVVITEKGPELITVYTPPTAIKPEVPARPVLPADFIESIEEIDGPEEVTIPTTEDIKPITEIKPPVIEKNDNYEDAPFYEISEVMPQPVGGLKSIYDNLVYPQMAIKAGIQGQVTVLAFIDEAGNVVNTQLLKTIGGGCDEAAVEAIKKTKFNPGKQRERPVKVRMMIPVKFVLK